MIMINIILLHISIQKILSAKNNQIIFLKNLLIVLVEGNWQKTKDFFNVSNVTINSISSVCIYQLMPSKNMALRSNVLNVH
jgi:hypothetical protein